MDIPERDRDGVWRVARPNRRDRDARPPPPPTHRPLRSPSGRPVDPFDPTRSSAGPIHDPHVRPIPQRAKPELRPRMPGWSVVLATVANLTMLVCITMAGLSLVGAAACVVVAVMSWFLVLAELLSLHRLYGSADHDGGHRDSDADRRTRLDDPDFRLEP